MNLEGLARTFAEEILWSFILKSQLESPVTPSLHHGLPCSKQTARFIEASVLHGGQSLNSDPVSSLKLHGTRIPTRLLAARQGTWNDIGTSRRNVRLQRQGSFRDWFKAYPNCFGGSVGGALFWWALGSEPVWNRHPTTQAMGMEKDCICELSPARAGVQCSCSRTFHIRIPLYSFGDAQVAWLSHPPFISLPCSSL